jgi:hypothetical protein
VGNAAGNPDVSQPGTPKLGRYVRAVNSDDPFDGDGAPQPWHPTTLPVPSRYLPLREVLREIERQDAVSAWAFGTSDEDE